MALTDGQSGLLTKEILMIVANPATSTTLGWPVGFWASELIHPYDALVKAGYEVTIASPKGGKVEFDALSDPRDDSGYSKDDTLSLAYIRRPGFMQLLEHTPAISNLDTSSFDAIIVCGGQSPMFTFRGDWTLAALFMEFYNGSKVSSALCHGTCLLLDTKLQNGQALNRGKTMTGFANSEADYADKVVGKRSCPSELRMKHESLSLIS